MGEKHSTRRGHGSGCCNLLPPRHFLPLRAVVNRRPAASRLQPRCRREPSPRARGLNVAGAEKQLLPWKYRTAAGAKPPKRSEPGGTSRTPPGARWLFQNLREAGVRPQLCTGEAEPGGSGAGRRVPGDHRLSRWRRRALTLVACSLCSLCVGARG